MRASPIIISLLLSISSSIASVQAAPAARQTAKVPYKRADFLVSGASCAACLIRIEKKLKALKGVEKATVSIYRPYAASVIYDPAKTSFEKVSGILASEKAKPESVSEEEIRTIPIILLPRGASKG